MKAKTRSILHVPLNIGTVFKNTIVAIQNSAAQDANQFIVLSRDISPWSAEHFFAVTKDIPGQKMVRLSGDYRTKVFEGSFKNMGKWCEELTQLSDGDKTRDRFFFYTTCPRCAKYYGKNYIVGLVAMASVAYRCDHRCDGRHFVWG